MLRGLYTAYTGMRNEQKRLDVISNNIANAATVGYKTESVSNQSFDDALTLKIKDQTTPYKYEDFYEAASNTKFDIFKCYETGKNYLPGQNELFEYDGDIREKSLKKKKEIER